MPKGPLEKMALSFQFYRKEPESTLEKDDREEDKEERGKARRGVELSLPFTRYNAISRLNP